MGTNNVAVASFLKRNNANGDTALHFACQNSQDQVVKWLVKDLKMPFNGKNNKGQTAIHVASIGGAIDSLKLMLTIKRGGEGMKLLTTTDADGKDALWHSCENEHHDIVEFLLKKGVDPAESPCPNLVFEKYSEVV